MSDFTQFTIGLVSGPITAKRLLYKQMLMSTWRRIRSVELIILETALFMPLFFFILSRAHRTFPLKTIYLPSAFIRMPVSLTVMETSDSISNGAYALLWVDGIFMEYAHDILAPAFKTRAGKIAVNARYRVS